MSTSTPFLDRSTVPPPGPIRPFHLPPVAEESMDNGLEIWFIPRGQVPLVSACLVLDSGETRSPAEKGGLAVLAGDALQGGTERRTGAQLAEALEGLGSGLLVSTGWDSTSIRFTCVAERFDEMMGLLSEVVRAPSFPSHEFERVREQRLASIGQRRMQPASLADDELDRRVFDAGHHYHRPVAGDEGSVKSLSREDTVAFVSDRYSPGGAGLVVVGDLSGEQVVQTALRHFGEWVPGRAPGVDVSSPTPPPARSVTVIHRPGSVQSELRIGHPAPPRGHEDEIPLRVSNTVLGGAFTSRLNRSLREEHGFTYGARSTLALRRDGGAYTMRTAVQTEVTAPALSEALAVLERFAKEGPTADELERARDYLAGVFPLRMETTAQLAARFAELIVFGLPSDYHHQYRDLVRAVGLDAALTAVRAHLRPDRAAVVVVGDADRVAPELEAAGLGPVEVSEPWA